MVIRRDTGIDAVSYFHLEFDSYAVIYAEGAPAESFVDGESRAMFDNVADTRRAFLSGSTNPGASARIEEGAPLEIVRRRLSQCSPRSATSADLSGGLTAIAAEADAMMRLEIARVRLSR